MRGEGNVMVIVWSIAGWAQHKCLLFNVSAQYHVWLLIGSVYSNVVVVGLVGMLMAVVFRVCMFGHVAASCQLAANDVQPHKPNMQ